MSFSPKQLETLLSKMLAHSELEGEFYPDKRDEFNALTLELGDIVVGEIKKYNSVLESKNTTKSIGKCWLPNEKFRKLVSYQCPCVHDGKVELVVDILHDDLSLDHLNGEWCPCDEIQKKWIYLNEPSTKVECAGCRKGNPDYHLDHFTPMMVRIKTCRFSI
jgi:hypothetical protein